MVRSAAPLIARLRRRLVTSAWLFAFLVLAKSLLATSCVADGLAASAPAGAASSVEAWDDGLSMDGDDGEAPCWHGGAAGCHCSCVHGIALPADAITLPSAFVPSSSLDIVDVAFASSRQGAELRPPIA